MTIQQAFEIALQHHQAGRLAEAETIYRQILAAEPRHAATLNLLGVLAHQVGRHDVAVEHIRQAIALAPGIPAFYSNLGEAYRMQGCLEEAVDADRQAITLQPDYPEAHYNLGVALQAKGQLEEAIAAYRQAIAFQPNFPEAHNNLGNALKDQGRLDEAIAAYRQAIALQPDYPSAHCNLGNALWEKGQPEEAIAACRRAIALQPDFPEAFMNLGNALHRQGQVEEAIAAFRQAIALRPNYPEACNNLGVALKDSGQLNGAIAACRQAITLQPDYPEAHSNLGNAFKDADRLDEAIAAYRQAIALRPDHPAAYANLGSTLKDLGRLDKAIAACRQASALGSPSPLAESNLLYTLHFHPGFDARAIAEEHRRWNQQWAAPLRSDRRPHANDRDPERRLRIGYVSPDFWHHVICHFLTPLLEAHDHAQFEIFCYASVKRPDAITGRLRQTADVWREVLGVRDEALAEMIRADQIDILVDLTQHMADHRLLVFARRPAPVQVAWLGYPASTGLETMDYRFTDAFMEPVGSAWSESVETPVRLPDSWFCFDPINTYPEPGPLPALTAGHVTFGSLNNFCKINEAVLQLWLQMLQSVDGSRLLLKCPAGSTQARVRQWFEAQGLAPHRLELFSRTATRAEFLRLFARIDLALEPFPYNGGTTTCEALWMGLPVPTFPGASAVSRIGLSILTAAGLPELIAADRESYVRLVVSLASDLPRLATLRSTLRPRMKASAFMDAPRFARNVEQAYREMWRTWCAGQSARLS